MKTKAKNRYIELDAVRAICALYIVAVWHMNQYLVSGLKFTGNLLNCLHNVTLAVLATFVFISGLLLHRYQFHSLNNVMTFYKKRLKRFLNLLCIASTTYLVFSWISIGQFAQILTGSNLIIGPSVPTLWFFSMMILFYIITPFVGQIWKNKILRYSVVFAIYMVFILLNKYFGADFRLLLYFPVYIAGLYLGVENLYRTFAKNSMQLVALVFIAVFMLPYSSVVCNYVSVSGGTLFMIALSFWICKCKNDRLFCILSFLSTSSMVAYLFHRQMLSPIQHGFVKIGFSGIPFWGAITSATIIFILSYYVQKYSDKYFK